MFGRADFVTVHVPLFPSIEGLVDEKQLRRMREDAVVINTSRSPVVDTEALETALREDWIERAALDVTEPEPLPGNHRCSSWHPKK